MTERPRTTPEKRCGVDLPPAGVGAYCPCELPEGHDGPHRVGNLYWPQGADDPGRIFGRART